MIKNKIHIYRAIIILIGIFAIGPLWSQQSKVQNLITFDDKPYHFGFFLGANQMLFTIITDQNFSEKYYTGDQIIEFDRDDRVRLLNIGYTPLNRPGFTVGIISNLRLGEYFDLRFTPDLQFSQGELIYVFEGLVDGVISDKYTKEVKKKLRPAFLNFPITLKYKGMRMHNIRPYLIVGGRLSINLSKKKSLTPTHLVEIQLKSSDIYADAGVGFDFYFNWFKMSTELKMSYGFLDMIYDVDNIWYDPIKKLKSKAFQFSVTFE